MQVNPIRSFGEISDLVAKGDLFVVNNSDLQNKQARGTVVLDILAADGTSQAVTVPATWIPINLAGFCDPTLILKAPTFRNLVNKNVLIVIKTEGALNILKTNAAKEEQKNVDELNTIYSKVMSTTPGITTTGPMTINTNASLSENVHVEAPLNNADDNELHSLVASFNAGTVSDSEAMAAMLTLNPSLDALKISSGNITNTGSLFYDKLSTLISEQNTAGNGYTGPIRPDNL